MFRWSNTLIRFVSSVATTHQCGPGPGRNGDKTHVPAPLDQQSRTPPRTPGVPSLRFLAQAPCAALLPEAPPAYCSIVHWDRKALRCAQLSTTTLTKAVRTRIIPLRLQPYGVMLTFGKARYLCFEGRAIAWAYPPSKFRRCDKIKFRTFFSFLNVNAQVYALAYHAVRLGCGVSFVTY